MMGDDLPNRKILCNYEELPSVKDAASSPKRGLFKRVKSSSERDPWIPKAAQSNSLFGAAPLGRWIPVVLHSEVMLTRLKARGQIVMPPAAGYDCGLYSVGLGRDAHELHRQ